MATNTPVSTVYVHNLEERVKLDTLTDTLRIIFSQFGNVVDIVAKKNLKAKGQAFVVFDNAENAQQAIDEVQGFEIFDKPMNLAMAKSKSDKTVELNHGQSELEQHKQHRIAEKEKRKLAEAEEDERNLKRAAAVGADKRPTKAAKPGGLKSTGVPATNIVPDEYLPPNKILFLQNVPEDYDVEALTTIFARFEGFREVRLVPGRKGIAFVEYDGEPGAIKAKESLGGMSLGDKNLKVTYQRQ